ncbi:MAG: hypothetical protein K6A95_02070 [Bacteroidales bacterium]|nr:hypothetical protein [Bacteroidales bacterium]
MQKRNIFNNLIPVMLLAVFCTSCGLGDCGENIHFRTDSISNNIYQEEYRCFCGGATTTDVIYVYVTDSVSFRKYVGKFDDQDYIFVKCRNDSIVDVYQKKDVGVMEHKYKTKLMNSYNLNDLRRKKKFDSPCAPRAWLFRRQGR